MLDTEIKDIQRLENTNQWCLNSIKKWKIRLSVDTKPRSGRPTKISATTARKIGWDAKKNPQATSAEIQDCLANKWCGCFKMHNKEVRRNTNESWVMLPEKK